MPTSLHHLPHLIRPALRVALVSALAWGCDASEPARAQLDAGVDADIQVDADADVDGGLPPSLVCDLVAFEESGVQLIRCDDGAHHSLNVFGAEICRGLTAHVSLGGETLAPEDYPQAVWLPTAQGEVEGRFSGLPGRPVLLWRLGLVDGQLRSRVSLQFDEASDTQLVRLAPLSFSPWGGCRPDPRTEAPRWRAWGPDGAAPMTWSSALSRNDGHCMWGAEQALCVLAEPPASRGLVDRHAVDVHAAPEDRVAWTLVPRFPPLEISQPARLDSTQWWLAVAPSTADIGQWWSRRLSALIDPSISRPEAPWGWTSSGAYGALVNASVLRAHLESLSELEGLTPPELMMHGIWYPALGEWRPGAAFDEVWPALDATLGVQWPLLQVSDETRILAEQPQIRLLSSEGAPIACGDDPSRCGILDPRQPAVRDLLVRSMMAWPTSVRTADLTALAAALEADPQGIVALVDALQAASDIHLTLPADAGWPVMRRPLTLRVAGGVQSPLGADCAEEDREYAGPRTDSCERALVDLQPDDGGGPSPDWSSRPRAIAHDLQRLWPAGAAGHVLDPGPLVLGAPLPDNIARQWSAVGLIAGGPWRLGDQPEGLSARRWRLFADPLLEGLTGQGAAAALADKVSSVEDAPPGVWRRSGQLVVIFNWGDSRLTVEGADRWVDWSGPTARLFDESQWEDPAEIGPLILPPQDVVVLRPVVE
ncbi:MAG: hypothetical protein ACE366_05440 [Bradymonadia bacterium]